MGKIFADYQKRVDDGELTFDPVQVKLIEKLEVIYERLIRQKGWFRQFIGKRESTRGLYFWGSVGTGKTFIMDMFFQRLPFKDKMRLHFHRFMNQVEKQLTELQGQANPLELVAKSFAKKTRVLCFDEFFVNDIGDAMILERLFTALFKQGITLVATSNIPPERLYLDGLHRKRFLPAITLIKQHCDVFHVESVNDYRFRALEQAGLYFHPLNKESEKQMDAVFNMLKRDEDIKTQPIEVEKRLIHIVKESRRVIWFDFHAICAPPRSQVDYINIAERYDVVLVSNVPVIPETDVASITYFINLVDVLYDERVTLVLSAEVLPPLLYPSGEKHFEYERTLSRLQEMQSKEYLFLSRQTAHTEKVSTSEK